MMPKDSVLRKFVWLNLKVTQEGRCSAGYAHGFLSRCGWGRRLTRRATLKPAFIWAICIARRAALDDAEGAYRDALKLRPAYADALNNLGSLLRDTGRVAEAERALSDCGAIAPAFRRSALQPGNAVVDLRRYSEAAGHLRSSLAVDPKQADAQYWLGNASMGLGDSRTACAAYEAAIQLDAGHAKARWGLVMAQVPPVTIRRAPPRTAAAFTRELGKAAAWLDAQKPKDVHAIVGAQQPFYLAYVEGNHREALSEYGQLCNRPDVALGSQRRAACAFDIFRRQLPRGIVSSTHPQSIRSGMRSCADGSSTSTRSASRCIYSTPAASRTARLPGPSGAFPLCTADRAIGRNGRRSSADARLDVLLYPESGWMPPQSGWPVCAWRECNWRVGGTRLRRD
jgi:tetratricopeptide (TPR) repeat protein